MNVFYIYSMQVNHYKAKFILTFLAVLFCSIVYSQKDTSKFKPHWEMGICFSPYEVCDIKAQNGFNHKYSNKYAFVLGVNTRFNFARRSSVTTGYNVFGFKYKVNYVWIVNQSGDPNMPLSGNIRMRYLDFPLSYNFKFILKKNYSIYATSGATYSLIGAISDKTTFANNTTRNSGFATKSLLSYQFGIGFEFGTKKGDRVTIEPYYRIFNKGFDTVMYQTPRSFGVKVTIFSKIQWKCFFQKGAWKPWPTCD